MYLFNHFNIYIYIYIYIYIFFFPVNYDASRLLESLLVTCRLLSAKHAAFCIPDSQQLYVALQANFVSRSRHAMSRWKILPEYNINCFLSGVKHVWKIQTKAYIWKRFHAGTWFLQFDLFGLVILERRWTIVLKRERERERERGRKHSEFLENCHI